MSLPARKQKGASRRRKKQSRLRRVRRRLLGSQSIAKDVQEMIRLLEQDKKTGPYQLIVPINMFGGNVTKKQQRWKFALDTKVRVRGVRRGVARIQKRHPEIAHGAVHLDTPIDGTQWWNEDALVRVKKRSR